MSFHNSYWPLSKQWESPAELFRMLTLGGVLVADLKISLKLRFEDNLGSLSVVYEKGLHCVISQVSPAGMRQQFGRMCECCFCAFSECHKTLSQTSSCC